MDKKLTQLQQLFSEGAALLQSGNTEQALTLFQSAQRMDPTNPTLYLYIGTSLHNLKRFNEAIACYKKALQITPLSGEIHNNLGNSLMALARFTEAAESYSKAVELLPASPVPLTARATALQAQGMVAKAEADCRMALLLDPAFAAAHWNLALNLLLQGRYDEGWREYEWRWLKPGFTSPLRHTDVPLWDGSPLGGRTILLHAEQGFGDAIQFIRYAPLVSKLGGNVILECHPQLLSLFKSMAGIQEVIPFGSNLPPFSFQAPLLSLPRIFGTTLENVPAAFPYLSIATKQRQKWTNLIPFSPEGLRVGLVWAGKSYPDPLRSCNLADFAPLAAVNNVVFYSLQVGDGSEQAKFPPSKMHLIDLTDQIHDFADTAALIEHLDLVISIDTAVVHLAGALGKPTWLLLPFAPDWRWLLDRSSSPWYPTMKIFRQKQSGNWGDAILRISSDLHAYTLKQIKNPLSYTQRIVL